VESKKRVYILAINVTQFTVDIIYICVCSKRNIQQKRKQTKKSMTHNETKKNMMTNTKLTRGAIERKKISHYMIKWCN
jgi:hypothetical protein